MNESLRATARAAASYAQAIFAALGVVSLVAWLVDVLTSKRHHPLTYWLVVSLALLLVAALIWGSRRGSPSRDGIHIHMEGGDIVYQVGPGEIPSGAPEVPAPGNPDAKSKEPGQR